MIVDWIGSDQGGSSVYSNSLLSQIKTSDKGFYAKKGEIPSFLGYISKSLKFIDGTNDQNIHMFSIIINLILLPIRVFAHRLEKDTVWIAILVYSVILHKPDYQ